LFKWGGPQFEGTRSFTFGKTNLSTGKHIVRMQWYTSVGENAQIRDRALSVNTAAAGSGNGRLVTTATESDWITKNTAGWEDVPNLSRSITLDGTRNLKITVSAQTFTGSGQFFARALVDGAPTADVLFEAAGVSGAGARSYSFVKNGVASGTHTVKIQWSAQGGTVFISDRALSVFAAPAKVTGGGLVTKVTEQAPTPITSTGWVDVPNTASTFTTSDPSTDVEVEVGAEVEAFGGRLFLRPTIDGQPTRPGDVTFTLGSQWRAQTYAFVVKNVLPGTHTVNVTMAVDFGATGYVGDRTVNVTVKRRAGVDFAQPYSSLSPRTGTFPVMVICFDPRRPGVAAPSLAYLRAMHEGTDGGRNEKSWFAENTGGVFGPGSVQYVGCNDSGWLAAPAGREGTWYWDHGEFPLMWHDALVAADPFVDFHSYDRDGNGYIDGNELVVEIVRPQDGAYGTNRTATAPLDGRGDLSMTVVDAYISSLQDNNNRLTNVGVLSHETCHDTIGAVDMYWNVTTRPSWYSIMDAHWNANHLDPFHKLKSGFVTPDVVETNKWSTKTVKLASVETKREITIVYDPRRGDKEYFILENRWGGSGTGNYDRSLPPPQGIVVWHIIEDVATMDAFPPPGDPVSSGEWGRKGVRLLGTLSASGQSKTLTWADGSAVHIRVTAKAGPQEQLSTEIAKV
jgi:M6 family metalloprotease-like protein